LEEVVRGSYILPVTKSGVLFPLLALTLGCHALDRDNPVDPAAGDGGGGAGLSLVIALPKALSTVVDSLVARLSGPGMIPVVKPLDYTTPLGPATLTIGALSPGSDRTLTIEGYALTGRLILSGQRDDIHIITGDTTRITSDLRLTIDRSELDEPDTTAAVADTTMTATPDEEEDDDEDEDSAG